MNPIEFWVWSRSSHFFLQPFPHNKLTTPASVDCLTLVDGPYELRGKGLKGQGSSGYLMLIFSYPFLDIT